MNAKTHSKNFFKGFLAALFGVSMFFGLQGQATANMMGVMPLPAQTPLTTNQINGFVTPSSTPTSTTETKEDFAEILEIILKVIYLLLWPFLALAGLALDNGMVYGSYFQLDSALFTFWNIVKNFSNFALGFLFLRSILKYIFNFGNKAVNPMGMISKLLIAGIGIQASRFLMGALVDLSTVATVGIGGLPLQLLKQEQVGNKPLFGLKTNLKISDIGNTMTTEKGYVILYTYPTKQGEYYLPCAVQNQKMLRGDDWGAVFGVTATGKNIGNTDVKWPDQINQKYCIFGNDVMSKTYSDGKLIQPGSAELKTMLVDSQKEFRSDNNCDTNSLCQTVSNIADKGKGYQGAFYSLYGSLLNLGSIHVNVNKSTGSMTLEAVIKAIIGIAYLIPLLVLCVVLIIRIAVLRVTIAFSPILVLSEVFEFNLGDLKKFGIKNAISMIFLPVMATFAISISIVFLSVLSEGLTKGDSLDKIGMGTYAEGNQTCINLVVTTLCLDTPSQDIGVSGMLDFFPWLILNIFGIGLMRTILMATMKSTAFTSGVVNSMDKFAKNLVTTANIIPIGGGTSIAAMKNAGRQISNSIDSAAARNANTVVSPTIENILQKNFTGKVGEGKKALKASTEKIKTSGDAARELSSLVGTGGALYNSPSSGISMSGNQLDLKQFGNEGLDLINEVAKTSPNKLNNGKAYESIDSAFKDPEFLHYLAAPKTADGKGGLGLSPEEIKSLYSGRDDLDNKITQHIEQVVANAGPAPIVTGTQKGNTFTTTDNESEYAMTKNGFMQTKKGSAAPIPHTDETARKALLPVMDKTTMKKMRDDGKITPSESFDKRLNATEKTGETPTAKPTEKPAASADTPATPVTPATNPNTNPTPAPTTPAAGKQTSSGNTSNP